MKHPPCGRLLRPQAEPSRPTPLFPSHDALPVGASLVGAFFAHRRHPRPSVVSRPTQPFVVSRSVVFGEPSRTRNGWSPNPQAPRRRPPFVVNRARPPFVVNRARPPFVVSRSNHERPRPRPNALPSRPAVSSKVGLLFSFRLVYTMGDVHATFPGDPANASPSRSPPQLPSRAVRRVLAFAPAPPPSRPCPSFRARRGAARSLIRASGGPPLPPRRPLPHAAEIRPPGGPFHLAAWTPKRAAAPQEFFRKNSYARKNPRFRGPRRPPPIAPRRRAC